MNPDRGSISGLVFLLVILILTLAAGEGVAAEWQIPFEIINGAAERDTIIFGVHPDGTPGIDPGLGEVGLPPWPPGSLFESRFMIPDCEGLKLDLRDSTHTERSHIIRWQAGAGGYPVTVKWDRLSLPYASLYLTDGYGGVFFDPPVNLYEADSLVVPSAWSFLSLLEIRVIPGVSPGADPILDPIPDLHIFAGQQFPEIPLDEFVFDPDTPDEALGWYVTENEALVFEFDENRVLHIHAPEGWIGAETVTLTVTDPENHTDQIAATFSVAAGGLPAWTIPVHVSNAAGDSRIASFGIHPDGTDGIDLDLGEIGLPPWPPSGYFDLRFLLPDELTFSVRDIRESSPDSTFYHLRWQATANQYPITIEWPDNLPLGDFCIRDNISGIHVSWTDMREVTQIVIDSDSLQVNGMQICAVATVDSIPPVGSMDLMTLAVQTGVSVSLGWQPCIEEHFAYYEIFFDSVAFDSTDASFVWDWTEDEALTQIETSSTTIDLPDRSEWYFFRIRAWDLFGNPGAVSELNSVSFSAVDDFPDHGPGDGYPKLSVGVWPNPVRAQASIWCAGLRAGEPTITIYDVVGRAVNRWVLDREQAARGSASVQWDVDPGTGGAGSGVYFLRVESGGQMEIRRVIVVR